MFGVIPLTTREKKDEQESGRTATTARTLKSGSGKAAGKRAITFIDYTSTLTNPRQAGQSVDKRRKDVRVHAAMASADKRKATIARKDAYGWQRRARLLSEIQVYKSQHTSNDGGISTHKFQVGPDTTAFNLLAEFVTELNPDSSWFTGPIERTSLSGKAIRTTLWGAVTNNSTLFQAAVFIAGTHSNTCGLPPTAIHDLSTGMLLLRGASLAAIQAAVMASEVESLTPVAIAMLAGWERRFGDPRSYEVHMQAWRNLSIPSKALDENNVSSLAELTLETFREGLDERAAMAPDAPAGPHHLKHAVRLPIGFAIFHRTLHYAETRSLLRIMSEFNGLDPSASDSISRMRRLGLENLSWTPCHTLSCQSIVTKEEEWDQEELNALYHVRAASISIGAMLILECHKRHNRPWLLDLDSALAEHTVSCQHLRTEELLGTQYAEVAVWSRFVLCATSRDPDRDELIRHFLQCLDIHSWPEMKSVLQRYLWFEHMIGSQCRDFFDIIVPSGASQSSPIHDCKPVSLVDVEHDVKLQP